MGGQLVFKLKNTPHLDFYICVRMAKVVCSVVGSLAWRLIDGKCAVNTECLLRGLDHNVLGESVYLSSWLLFFLILV